MVKKLLSILALSIVVSLFGASRLSAQRTETSEVLISPRGDRRTSIRSKIQAQFSEQLASSPFCQFQSTVRTRRGRTGIGDRRPTRPRPSFCQPQGDTDPGVTLLELALVDENTDMHSAAKDEPSLPPGFPGVGAPPSCNVSSYVGLLKWPIAGEDAKDWVTSNYRDLDFLKDLTFPFTVLQREDYTSATGSNAKTYDQHRGLDILTFSFRGMDDNSDLILSATDGTVETIEEGQFDRFTAWAPGCTDVTPAPTANRINIRHSNGFLFSYLHLKQNSVTDTAGLSVGDKVDAGGVLGVVGSAGCSSHPHIHFQVNDCDANVVDPFKEGMWVNPPGYDTPLGFMGAVISKNTISGSAFIKDPPPDATAVVPGAQMGIGVMLGGRQPGETFNLQIIREDGSQHSNSQVPFNGVFQRSWWWWSPTPTDIPGEWTANMLVNGTKVAERKFNVSKYAGFTAFKLVRFGIPAANYQYEVDHFLAAGYRPIWVDSYKVSGNIFYNAIYVKDGVPFVARHGLTGAEYDQLVNDFAAQGYRIRHVDTVAIGNQIFFAVVMDNPPSGGPPWAAFQEQTKAEYDATFADMKTLGFHPVIISPSVLANGTKLRTSVFEKSDVGEWLADSNMTEGEYQEIFDEQLDDGKRLLYLNAYNENNGTAKLSAIWFEDHPYSATEARHDLSTSGLQSEFDDLIGDGFATRMITGYADNFFSNSHRFAAFWTK